jgi:hypothetical protein
LIGGRNKACGPCPLYLVTARPSSKAFNAVPLYQLQDSVRWFRRLTGLHGIGHTTRVLYLPLGHGEGIKD